MFINEIVWTWTRGGCTNKNLTNKYNQILYYSKCDSYYYNQLYTPYKEKRSYFKNGDRGKFVVNVWTDISGFNTGNMNEKSDYPTEKPFKLLERIICLSTK